MFAPSNTIALTSHHKNVNNLDSNKYSALLNKTR